MNYSDYTVFDQSFLLHLLEEISNKIVTFSSLKSDLKKINSNRLIRAIAWTNKFDVVEIQTS